MAMHFDVSVFEKLRFWPSTLHHLAGVFQFLQFRDRFRKAPFSVTENAVLVWTVGQTGEKKMRFQTEFIQISVDGASKYRISEI